MFLSKVKIAAVLVLVLGFVDFGLGRRAMSAAEPPEGLRPDAANQPVWSVVWSKTDIQGADGALAVSPDGKLVAVGKLDGSILIYDQAAGKERATLRKGNPGGRPGPVLPQGPAGHKGMMMSAIPALGGLTFSPDGKSLASWGIPEGEVQLWNVEPPKWRATLPATMVNSDLLGMRMILPSTVSSAAISPDSKQLATIVMTNANSSGVEVKLWDLGTAKAFGRIQVAKAVSSGSVAFAPDGKYVAFTSTWLTGKESNQPPMAKAGDVPEGSSPMAVVVDVAAKKEIWRSPVLPYREGVGHLLYGADAKSLVLIRRNGTVETWDPTTGKLTTSFAAQATGETKPFSGQTALPSAISGAGKTLATADEKGQVRFWDLKTGKLLQSLAAHPGKRLTYLAFAPGDQVLLTSCLSKSPQAVGVWAADADVYGGYACEVKCWHLKGSSSSGK